MARAMTNQQAHRAMQAGNNARRVLAHYFQTIFNQTGLKWDNDNEAEIAGIVEDIVTAVTGEN